MNTTAQSTPVPSMDLRRLVRRYWRQRGVILLVAGVVLALSVTLALVLPPTYTSGATILLSQQEIF